MNKPTKPTSNGSSVAFKTEETKSNKIIEKKDNEKIPILPPILPPPINSIPRKLSPPFPVNNSLNQYQSQLPPNIMFNNHTEHLGTNYTNPEINNSYPIAQVNPYMHNQMMGYDPHFRTPYTTLPNTGNSMILNDPRMMPRNGMPPMFNNVYEMNNRMSVPMLMANNGYRSNSINVASFQPTIPPVKRELVTSENKAEVPIVTEKKKRRKNKAFKYKGRYVCVICADKAGILIKNNNGNGLELMDEHGNITKSFDQCVKVSEQDLTIPFSFSTSGHLTRHLRLHSGVKDHVCPEKSCGKRFGRKDNMRQHYKIHLKKKNK